ncbi:MAG: 3-deoxy-D-manno-octulosonic acid transferase [Roseimicrobium sp.]
MLRLLVLLCYNLVYPLALVAMAPAAWRKMTARGGQARDLWQRLGFFSDEVTAKLRDWQATEEVLWIHAVSVGEVGIAAKLIRELRCQRPALKCVLTSTTPTGWALAGNCEQEHNGAVLPLYSPLDGWGTVRRFLATIRPERLILVEAEVWPNLVFAARRRNVPVALVNARLSPRSERRFRSWRWLAQPVYEMISHICVQEAADVVRFAETFGVDPARIHHTGSIKFDMAGEVEPVAQVAEFRSLIAQLGWQPDAPILLAASTHAGEEIELGRVWQRVAQEVVGLRCVIVPRHVERTASIELELAELGVLLQRRSQIGGGGSSAPVLLVDTTGELRAWQYLADVVVVGKSFLATGGQNPAEAAMAGVPVVFGPHMENFDALVALLLSKGGASQVQDFAELEVVVRQLLQNPSDAKLMAEAGRAALQAHEGSTRRTVAALLR